MHRAYWIAFLACQVMGCVLPVFANVHMNIGPLLLGILLLLPGSLVGMLLPNWTDLAIDPIVIAINFGAWYSVKRLITFFVHSR